MAVIAQFGRADQSVRLAICTAAEDVGHWVYVEVEKTATDPEEVRKANPTDFNKMPAVGVIISKITATLCEVQWFGETPDVLSGLGVGEVHYLAHDGTAKSDPPIPGGSPVFWQTLGIGLSADSLYVKPDDQLRLRRP